MAQYTIATAQFKEQKQISGNDMSIYVIGVTDANGQLVNCELLQRPTTQAPQPGQTIVGDIKPASNPQYLPTFKREQKQNGRGGGGGGGYGPEDIARITRSHAQKMALGFIQATGGVDIDWNLEAGDEDQRDAEITAGVAIVKRVANWFQNDVHAAAKAVAGQKQQPAPAPAQQPPAQQPPAQQPPAQQPPAQQPPAQQQPPPASPQEQPEDDIPF